MKKKLETIFSLMNEIKAKIMPSTFAEVTLEDGTVLTWDGDLAVGTAVFVNDGTNTVPAPEGTHKLTGDYAGKSIVLDKDGMVTEIIDETATAGMSEDGSTEAKSEIFSKKLVEHFAEIVQVNKWSMTIDQETIDVGTALTYSYTYGDSTDVYSVSAGEYETADGKAFLVDASGVVRMFLDGSTPATSAQTQSSEEMSKAIAEANETVKSVFGVVEQMSTLITDLSNSMEKQGEEFAEIKGRFEKFAKSPSDKTQENLKFSRKEDSGFTATQQRLLDSLNK